MIIGIGFDTKKDRSWGTKFAPTFQAYICPNTDDDPCDNYDIATVPDHEYNLLIGDSPIVAIYNPWGTKELSIDVSNKFKLLGIKIILTF